MLKTLQARGTLVRWVLGFVVGIIGLMMVVTLVPGPVGSLGEGTDAVADVAGERISLADVRRQMDQITRNQQIPRALQGFYARQILDQMIFERLLALEAKRIGLRVTEQELQDQIKLIVPTAFLGGRFVGMEPYAQEVQQRFGMSVPEFEDRVRQSLLEAKFRRLVTEGITVTPDEMQAEFQRRNEKVKIDYALVDPGKLETEVAVNEPDLRADFEKNSARYQIPERRSARYALLDLNLLRQKAPASEAEQRAYYNAHIDSYKIPNRVHVEHILFKTLGKTDAEVAEIRKKAEDVLKKAKQGAKFEELAKKYSEDTTKDKGGDLGWILQGQTVPEFERVAFSLPKGAVSDLVRTQYGFHIIKLLDHETARTESFDEVRLSILQALVNDKVEQLSNQFSDQMAAAVRQSSRQTLDDVVKSLDPLARECIQTRDVPPASANDPIGDLGTVPDLRDALFHLRSGELSQPIRTDRGYVILAVKDIEPAHSAAFAEVRSKVEADYRKKKAAELARSRAEELARRVKGGEAFPKAAKALGLEVKASEPFSRTGSVPGVGGAGQLSSAFTLPRGQTSSPTRVGTNWVVFRVVSRESGSPEDFIKQSKDIEQELLDRKRSAAFSAVRTALEDEMKREGKLRMSVENLKRLMNPS